MKSVIVHADHCLGCHQCEIACAVEHSASKDLASAVFERPLPKSRIHVEAGASLNTAFPGRCRHCDPAPCIDVCPTGALCRDDEFGLVLVRDSKCIACAMCAMVCPFDAVTFDSTATKCDGCIDRLDAGTPPACVEACKTGALEFGEINELIRASRIQTAARALAAAEASPPDGNGQGSEEVKAWRSWGQRASELARR